MPSAGKNALSGRIVTMNRAFDVIERGTLYIEGAKIAAVREASAAPPAGYPRAIDTRGTIYPGLIELHNHLSYNALRLWAVPQRFHNRDAWQGHPEYRQLVTGPMAAIGKSDDPKVLSSLVRYVESKCLLAGVTTTQGIALSSNSGIRSYYKGIVRNVEQPLAADLPKANTRIPDVAARDWVKFASELDRATCMLLHLSEGTDAAARRHFTALRNAQGEWAITPALAGIHSAGLLAEDLDVFHAHGGCMVWSPLSNYLLYGDTARIARARRDGIPIALGSDWSPTGSKNLLGELKTASVVSAHDGGLFADRELVAMATIDAARILKWDASLGSLETGKLADLVVIGGRTGDPYEKLIAADESNVALVMIGGTPRVGGPTLMRRLGAAGERVVVSGRARVVNYDDPQQDPRVRPIALGDAAATLKATLKNLPKAHRAPSVAGRAAAPRSGAPRPEVWRLALDEQGSGALELRPRLPLGARPTGPARAPRPKTPVRPLVPLALDPLTIADDAEYASRLGAQKNLPPWLKEGLVHLLT